LQSCFKKRLLTAVNKNLQNQEAFNKLSTTYPQESTKGLKALVLEGYIDDNLILG